VEKALDKTQDECFMAGQQDYFDRELTGLENERWIHTIQLIYLWVASPQSADVLIAVSASFRIWKLTPVFGSILSLSVLSDVARRMIDTGAEGHAEGSYSRLS
jgi:hypothetical protein